jgi:hypothetical protein
MFTNPVVFCSDISSARRACLNIVNENRLRRQYIFDQHNSNKLFSLASGEQNNANWR